MNTIQLLTNVLEKERQDYIDEFKKQGHSLSGKTENSFQVDVQEFGGVTVARVFVSEVALYQNYGVKAEKIPFRLGRGAKSSKFIAGLIKFWQLRKGLTAKEALSAAIATARKHKKEGMHTKNSLKFSQTGERTNSLSNRFKTVEQQIDNGIDEIVIQNFLE